MRHKEVLEKLYDLCQEGKELEMGQKINYDISN
jgi:hypothetical protein